MFDKKDIEAYESIKAPKDLKARIWNDCESNRPKRATVLSDSRFIKQMTAVAACFLLVVTVFSAGMLGGVDAVLSYEGESITDAGVAVAFTQPMAIEETVTGRAAAEIRIPLTFVSEQAMTVSVKDGMLYEADESGELLGEQIRISGERHLLWVLDAQTEASELTVKCGLRREQYGLQITEDEPTGMIYKK